MGENAIPHKCGRNLAIQLGFNSVNLICIFLMKNSTRNQIRPFSSHPTHLLQIHYPNLSYADHLRTLATVDENEKGLTSKR